MEAGRKRLDTITANYTAALQENNADMQHQIVREFKEHGETWNNILRYEQARWRWATEEQRRGPDTSISGYGMHAVEKAPAHALEASQAVQAAIQETARAREAREAWLLAPEGTTRQQLVHRGAHEVQHPEARMAEESILRPRFDQDGEWTPAQRQQYREAWAAQQAHFKAQEQPETPQQSVAESKLLLHDDRIAQMQARLDALTQEAPQQQQKQGVRY